MRQFAFKNLTVNVGQVGQAQLCFQTQPTCQVVCSPVAVGQSPIGCFGFSPLTCYGLSPIVCNQWSPPVTCPPISRFTGTGPGGCCPGLLSSTLPSPFFAGDFGGGVIDPAQIGVLREQLDQAVRVLDEQAEQLQTDLAPQSLEEAEELEGHLKEALGQVEAWKKDLKGK